MTLYDAARGGPDPASAASAATATAPAARPPASLELGRAASTEPARSITGASLAALAVEESGEGVVVTATAADGRAAARRARWTEGGLHEAVVAAVSDLASPAGQPLLIEVVESTVAGTSVLTVVLERVDGRRAAGAAVVEAGTAFAVGKAAWRALSE